MKKEINTPKWMTVYPIYEEWILRGDESQRKFVCDELKKLCEAVDNFGKKE